MTTQAIFVCGATGTQGGAVTRHLLKHGGYTVHSISRNPESSAAESLQSLGVKLLKGDFNDKESLRDSIKNCTDLFLNFMPDLNNLQLEVEHAKDVLSLAKEAGVKYVIYSSSLSIKEPQRHKYWDPNSFTAAVLLSKQAIENEVRTAGFEYWTILRPGYFMSNLLPPLVRMYPGLLENGCWTTALTPETKLALIDPDDIGRFAAAAFSNPARFNKQEIPLSSELLGVEEIITALSRTSGRHLEAVFMAQEEAEAQAPTNPFISGQLAMRDMDQFVDDGLTRSYGLPLGTFEQFLQREKAKVVEAYAGVSDR
ncbi:NAD dependent epimerase/dehydratase, putative [Paecilomyces variotii No. 5]|uniref:NAD dependent epimerase/dehydratase, putative n=1 Tax=Byssochlamys spectabilis (strain No. 5 / NBRC 109023) TaxID=1356009 RepID=V5FV76_BYSSN|nr:NAD dependent epimerase/dehydratase, putative [Paecilomyces variotii No. 5]